MSVATARATSEAEILDAEERDAWHEYLESTRGQQARYAEIEPWAWARLSQRRRALSAKRKKISGD